MQMKLTEARILPHAIDDVLKSEVSASVHPPFISRLDGNRGELRDVNRGRPASGQRRPAPAACALGFARQRRTAAHSLMRVGVPAGEAPARLCRPSSPVRTTRRPQRSGGKSSNG
jgi:hypothetical protein